MTAQKPKRNTSASALKSAFSGFDMPRQNWFKMPNEWTDITSEITSLAELKVVEYVLKHTWGYQEYGLKKRISIDEFMSGRRRVDGSRMDKGTGLSKPSVVSGIKSAVKRGLLIEEKDDSDKGRVKKYYTLRMKSEDDSGSHDEDYPEQPSPEGNEDRERSFTPGVKNLNRWVNNVYPRGKEDLHRTEKDTLERNLQERKTTTGTRGSDNNNTDGPDAEESGVVVALSDQGMTHKVARRLADRYSQQRIEEKIEFLEFKLEQNPNEVKSRAGWLKKAIEDDWKAPDGFVSRQERQSREEELRRQEAASEALREAEEKRLAKEKATQEQQQREFEQQLAAEWGTDDDDRALWEKVRMGLQQSRFSPALLPVMQLLKHRDGTAIIALPNDFLANQLTHPGILKQLKRELEYFTKQPVEIQIETVGGPD